MQQRGANWPAISKGSGNPSQLCEGDVQDSPVADAKPPFHFLVHAVPIDVACDVLHRGRSFVFELLGKRLLNGVKDGNRTLVTVESIRAYQANMPPAVFKAPPPPRLENLDRLHERERARAERRRKARNKSGVGG
jgi:hypothetical protein